MVLGGTYMTALPKPPLVFRHISSSRENGEISGHYHPKAQISLRGKSISKPCFLLDSDRLILPAYGTFTGGLKTQSEALCGLMRPEAVAILTGKQARPIPMPRD